MRPSQCCRHNVQANLDIVSGERERRGVAHELKRPQHARHSKHAHERQVLRQNKVGQHEQQHHEVKQVPPVENVHKPSVRDDLEQGLCSEEREEEVVGVGENCIG